MPRNNLFDDLDNLQWEMERLFHSFFNPKHPFHLLADKRWRPLTDMYEVDDELVIKVEIAGVHKDDISITLEDRLLVIKGTRDFPEQKSNVVYHQMEINYGEFERVLMMPAGIDTEKIKAELRDKEGFLYITISKKKED